MKGDTIAAAAEEVYTKHPRSPLAFCTCGHVCVTDAGRCAHGDEHCGGNLITGQISVERDIKGCKYPVMHSRTICARKWCVICTALPALHSMFASCLSSGLQSNRHQGISIVRLRQTCSVHMRSSSCTL